MSWRNYFFHFGLQVNIRSLHFRILQSIFSWNLGLKCFSSNILLTRFRISWVKYGVTQMINCVFRINFYILTDLFLHRLLVFRLASILLLNRIGGSWLLVELLPANSLDRTCHFGLGFRHIDLHFESFTFNSFHIINYADELIFVDVLGVYTTKKLHILDNIFRIVYIFYHDVSLRWHVFGWIVKIWRDVSTRFYWSSPGRAKVSCLVRIIVFAIKRGSTVSMG